MLSMLDFSTDFYDFIMIFVMLFVIKKEKLPLRLCGRGSFSDTSDTCWFSGFIKA